MAATRSWGGGRIDGGQFEAIDRRLRETVRVGQPEGSGGRRVDEKMRAKVLLSTRGDWKLTEHGDGRHARGKERVGREGCDRGRPGERARPEAETPLVVLVELKGQKFRLGTERGHPEGEENDAGGEDGRDRRDPAKGKVLAGRPGHGMIVGRRAL